MRHFPQGGVSSSPGLDGNFLDEGALVIGFQHVEGDGGFDIERFDRAEVGEGEGEGVGATTLSRSATSTDSSPGVVALVSLSTALAMACQRSSDAAA